MGTINPTLYHLPYLQTTSCQSELNLVSLVLKLKIVCEECVPSIPDKMQIANDVVKLDLTVFVIRAFIALSSTCNMQNAVRSSCLGLVDMGIILFISDSPVFFIPHDPGYENVEFRLSFPVKI